MSRGGSSPETPAHPARTARSLGCWGHPRGPPGGRPAVGATPGGTGWPLWHCTQPRGCQSTVTITCLSRRPPGAQKGAPALPPAPTQSGRGRLAAAPKAGLQGTAPPKRTPRPLTFISTDSLSFSRLTILTATFWQVTQWIPSFTRPGGGEARQTHPAAAPRAPSSRVLLGAALASPHPGPDRGGPHLLPTPACHSVWLLPLPSSTTGLQLGPGAMSVPPPPPQAQPPPPCNPHPAPSFPPADPWTEEAGTRPGPQLSRQPRLGPCVGGTSGWPCS